MLTIVITLTCIFASFVVPYTYNKYIKVVNCCGTRSSFTGYSIYDEAVFKCNGTCGKETYLF